MEIVTFVEIFSREFQKSRLVTSAPPSFPGFRNAPVSWTRVFRPYQVGYGIGRAVEGHTLERRARSRSRNLHSRVGATPQACLSASPGFCQTIARILRNQYPLFAPLLFICPSVYRLIYLSLLLPCSISVMVLIRMLRANLARSIKLARNASQLPECIRNFCIYEMISTYSYLFYKISYFTYLDIILITYYI